MSAPTQHNARNTTPAEATPATDGAAVLTPPGTEDEASQRRTRSGPAHRKPGKAPKVSSTGIPLGKLIVIFVGLLLGILMAALDQTIVATALPHIGRDLDGMSQISWLITTYLLAQTIVMPVYGKVGDFIGRKQAFMIAIVIFLVGSILAGIAPTMGVLITFRAVQGIGAGGLMIGAQTIIAEIVSARERGKYMSIMGPMIGVATVLGPLLGGYLTDTVSWRWIFYINLPIGLAALAITGFMLKLQTQRQRPSIDYWGVLSMAGAAASLVLLLTWGGREHAWDSPTIIGLGIAVLVLAPLFVLAEHRAKQPILPMHLFRDSVFRINTPLALLLGVAMFGAVSYLPTYLQLSLGASATMSGILLLPLMGGLMVAAVTTGQLMTRTGRYKIFPIMGTAIAAVGMYLISTMDAGTSRLDSSLYMIVLGLGIGFIMPTLILTVQNSVGPKDMSPATAGVNFFRQIGASVGTAIIGSMFVGRLATNLRGDLAKVPQDVMSPEVTEKLKGAGKGMTHHLLTQFPEPIQHAYIHAYADSLMPLYVYLVPFLVLAFVITLFLKEKPLSTTLRRGHGGGHDPAEDAKWEAAMRGRPHAAETGETAEVPESADGAQPVGAAQPVDGALPVDGAAEPVGGSSVATPTADSSKLPPITRLTNVPEHHA